MKPSNKILSFIAVGIAGIFLIVYVSPLFLNTKIDRVFEDDLPNVSIENDSEVYCRLQADDFRLLLPKVGVLSKPHVTSSDFDSIQGYLIVRFPTNPISPKAYEKLVQKPLQRGGVVSVTRAPYSDNLIVNFSYFGDK